jgi:hypothetical protein
MCVIAVVAAAARNVSVVAAGARAMRVHWWSTTPTATEGLHYRVMAVPSPDSGAQEVMVTTTEREALLEGLKANTKYRITVTAVLEPWVGRSSEPVWATTGESTQISSNSGGAYTSLVIIYCIRVCVQEARA